MKRRSEVLCTWGGIAFSVLFFVGFVIFARFLPPPSPDDTALQTATMYRERTNGIRIGMSLCYIGTMCFLAFGSGIVGQTRRIRNAAPAIIVLQIASFASAMLLLVFPIIIFFVAAFRPEVQSDANIQLFNDFGWISFAVGFPPFVVWIASTGVAILSDNEQRPLYPRWFGYFSLLMAFIQAPPVLLVFFKTGPFAWNGLLSWWLPLTDFFIWFMIATWLTLRAISNRDYGYPEDDYLKAMPRTAAGEAEPVRYALRTSAAVNSPESPLPESNGATS